MFAKSCTELRFDVFYGWAGMKVRMLIAGGSRGYDKMSVMMI